jgi:DNA-binding transcriptional regulator YiaG
MDKEQMHYHYAECGLDNIYLSNGFKFMETPRGQSISIHDIDGLHKAIGLYFVTSKKDLFKKEIRFLREEMLMSQSTLGRLLGVSEQAVRRWETGKTEIPKPSEFLLRLLYREHVNNQNSKISTLLKEIANLEDEINDQPILFVDTKQGWLSVA